MPDRSWCDAPSPLESQPPDGQVYLRSFTCHPRFHEPTRTADRFQETSETLPGLSGTKREIPQASEERLTHYSKCARRWRVVTRMEPAARPRRRGRIPHHEERMQLATVLQMTRGGAGQRRDGYRRRPGSRDGWPAARGASRLDYPDSHAGRTGDGRTFPLWPAKPQRPCRARITLRSPLQGLLDRVGRMADNPRSLHWQARRPRRGGRSRG